MPNTTPHPVITVLDALKALLVAYQYPHLGNEDAVESRHLEDQGLQLAQIAVSSSDDPPEFVRWIDILRSKSATNTDRETVYSEIADYLDPDYTKHIHLSPVEYQRFVDALNDNTPPSETLQQAARQYLDIIGPEPSR